MIHIEKNVCDNVIGPVLDIQGKIKDSLYASLDLHKMGICGYTKGISSQIGWSEDYFASYLLYTF